MRDWPLQVWLIVVVVGATEVAVNSVVVVLSSVVVVVAVVELSALTMVLAPRRAQVAPKARRANTLEKAVYFMPLGYGGVATSQKLAAREKAKVEATK